MKNKIALIMIAAATSVALSGCVVLVEHDGRRHPDRCYDCHSSWELDRWSVEVRCIEFEITVGSGGYWYKPVGTSDAEMKFHPFESVRESIVGPTMNTEP